MNSIDKFRDSGTSTIGGYYPFGNFNFVANKLEPLPEQEKPVKSKGTGIPIWSLHKPEPPQPSNVLDIAPTLPLSKEEMDLRLYNVEVEKDDEEKEKRREFNASLQTVMNMKGLISQNYKNVIQNKIYKISGSNAPNSVKIAEIHQLMNQADAMGVSIKDATPLILQNMEKYGLSVGFEDIIEELKQRLPIRGDRQIPVEKPPLAPVAVGGVVGGVVGGDGGIFGSGSSSSYDYGGAGGGGDGFSGITPMGASTAPSVVPFQEILNRAERRERGERYGGVEDLPREEQMSNRYEVIGGASGENRFVGIGETGGGGGGVYGEALRTPPPVLAPTFDVSNWGDGLGQGRPSFIADVDEPALRETEHRQRLHGRFHQRRRQDLLRGAGDDWTDEQARVREIEEAEMDDMEAEAIAESRRQVQRRMRESYRRESGNLRGKGKSKVRR